ncbi:MAG: zinc-binding dehydrogenase [Anaerolineae bacterium]|nr:zinc-binding dehydrogenase [Anaerolineae bacterium]
MKAIRLVQIGMPLQAQEIAVPAIGSTDVLVRVHAAGICHSDAHYRAGTSPVAYTPLTLGHEVAGVIEQVGAQVQQVSPGDRVGVHYLITCGECTYCRLGHEQFCLNGRMIGKHRDGGYAEYIAVPARSVVPLPPEIPFAVGAIMMCSTATSFHALRKARLQPGESVAVYGAGGLGMSALQLARACGALHVYAVDIDLHKLAMAERLGAIPIDARSVDPVAEIVRHTGGHGVDVALDLVGLPEVTQQAVRCLKVMGRAVLVGITDRSFSVHGYTEVLGKETEIIGASDHLLLELPILFELVRQRRIDLSHVVARHVPLEPDPVNHVLDDLDAFGADVRTVIVP